MYSDSFQLGNDEAYKTAKIWSLDNGKCIIFPLIYKILKTEENFKEDKLFRNRAFVELNDTCMQKPKFKREQNHIKRTLKDFFYLKMV